MFDIGQAVTQHNSVPDLIVSSSPWPERSANQRHRLNVLIVNKNGHERTRTKRRKLNWTLPTSSSHPQACQLIVRGAPSLEHELRLQSRHLQRAKSACVTLPAANLFDPVTRRAASSRDTPGKLPKFNVVLEQVLVNVRL